jgi:hypothetical protein
MASYIHNTGEHIDDIVDQTSCDKHNATQGVPCFQVKYGSGFAKGEFGPGVCGSRIKKAGYNGKIDPSSLRQKPSKAKPRRSYHT